MPIRTLLPFDCWLVDMTIKLLTTNRQLLAAVAILLVAPSITTAQTWRERNQQDDREPEFVYELRAGTVLSDNIQRRSFNAEDEIIAVLGGSVVLVRDSQRLQLDLAADLDFNHYIDGTYDDDISGSLDGYIEYYIVPSTFSWVVEERFGKLVTDPLQSLNPGNLENVNSFATGPNLNFRFGSKNSVRLQGRLRDHSFERRDIDNQEAGVSISLARRLNSFRTVSINGTYDDIDYKNDVDYQDYKRTAAYVGFSSDVGKGSLSLSIGGNAVDVDGETSEGLLARASFSRDLSSRTRFILAYDQRYSDAGDIFDRYSSPNWSFGEAQDIPGEGDPFESIRFSVTSVTEFGRNIFFLDLSTTDENYETDNELERRRIDVSGGVNRQIGSAWQLGGDVRFYNADYRNIDRQDDNLSIGIRVTRQLSQSIFADIGYRYIERSSNEPNSGYDENRIILMVRYSPFRIPPSFLDRY
jgi:hypothetical protein